ncbi:hypothetical protein HPULCUR_010215 [Helicostylum pulchrum]|uniref:RGS domain-containing protein n=1 Tax=Helicostylum pulchrum TaxID=562976 RepID=A0ABP9YEK8_9FUNG
MYYCTEPIPDCNNVATLENDYFAFNRTEQDCRLDRVLYISGRIYLSVALFNGVMVILTTGAYIYFATTGKANNTLQKRSVTGTTLGAVGHFVFSMLVLITPATNDPVGCELTSWGIYVGFYTWIFAFFIRAYRLRMLFRLNRLKVKYLRMTNSERETCINDRDYRWYLENHNNAKRSLVKPYILYLFGLAIILCIYITIEVKGGCSAMRAVITIIFYFSFFAVILVPFLMYYLKDNCDANGIRAEIRIVSLIGIPMFIVYMMFLLVVDPRRLLYGHFRRIVFMPVNWLLFLTALAHFFSVVIPLICYLPIRNQYWLKVRNWIGHHCRLQRRPTLVSTSFKPELTIESLERCMLDPELMQQLQDLAIRDFSSENMLFYERYLELEYQLNQEFSTRNRWINTYVKKKPGLDLLSTPVPQKMYPQFIQFYETFIQEDATSQVNISYRARNAVDTVFEYVYSHYRIAVEKNKECITVLTLGTFETTRIEVLWNIFGSVYPKLVSMYE